MASVQHLRDFIRDRLTAAAEDIFSLFEKTILQYEERLEHQRRPQESTWSPEVKHRESADLPQQHACNQEELLAAQQLCNQERSSSPQQENPECPQIKGEQEELCSSQEGEPSVLKQETDTVMVTATREETSDQLLSHTSDPDVFVDSKSKEILEVITKCVQVEVEIDHRGRVLDHTWNPVVKLYRTDLPQQHVCKQKEVLADQERNSSPEQENPKSPQIKEELCSSQEGEPPVQKQETDVGQPCLGPPAPVEPIMAPLNVSALSADSHLTLKTVTFTGKKLYPCNTCSKTFTTVFSFKRHSTVHTGEKPHLCNTCGKYFKAKGTLREHMRIHSKELMHVCSTCGKRFRDRKALKRHGISHTGEKPHVCDTCGKRSRDTGHLKRHMTIHTGEKPHVCDTCGKGFRDNADLKRHVKTHTGERPYLCNTCGIRYKSIKTLKVHMLKHTMQS